MRTLKTFLTASLVSLALAIAAPAFAQSGKAVSVVATFSLLGDIVKRIGGDNVVVTTLVGPDGDAHVYRPTPADARAVKSADLLFLNGLGFEGWIDRLVDAAEFDGVRVVATDGIKAIPFDDGHEDEPQDDHKDEHKDDDHAGKSAGHDDHGHDHGAFDPHAWQDIVLVETYVENIMLALAQADPKNAAAYYRNRTAYVAELRSLDEEIRSLMAAIPAHKRTVVTSHDAFGYFAASYGLTIKAPQGFSTESEASAADVAELIVQIRKSGISAVFIESITDNRILEQIARETGAEVGGTLYSDALSGPSGPASTYLKMMRHNATSLAAALAS